MITCIQDSRGGIDGAPPRVCFDEPDNLERDRRTLEFLDECQLAAREAVVATVLETGDCPGIRRGDRLFVTSAGAAGELLGTVLDRDLLRNARASLSERRSRGVFFGDCHIWLEWAGPPTHDVVLEPFVDIDTASLEMLEQAESIFRAAAAATTLRPQPAFETEAALEGHPETQMAEPIIEQRAAMPEPVAPVAKPHTTGLAAAVAHVRAALRWSDREAGEPPPKRRFDARKGRPLGIDFDLYSSNQPGTATNPA